MPELRARADDACELCGRPIDFNAPARSSRSSSVDHVVPIHAGGVELPPLEELRLVHYGCNSRRGNRTRAHARASGHRVTPAVELMPIAEPREREYIPHRRTRKSSSSELEAPSLFDELDVVDEKSFAADSQKKLDGFFSDAATDRKSVV